MRGDYKNKCVDVLDEGGGGGNPKETGCSFGYLTISGLPLATVSKKTGFKNKAT